MHQHIVVGDPNDSDSDEQNEVWVCLGSLNLDYKAILLDGHCLTDKHIALAQALLKKQFPSINGLKSTLVAERHGKVLPSNGLKFYWFVVTTGYCCQQCRAPKIVQKSVIQLFIAFLKKVFYR